MQSNGSDPSNAQDGQQQQQQSQPGGGEGTGQGSASAWERMRHQRDHRARQSPADDAPLSRPAGITK